MALRVTRRRFFPARLLALTVVVLAPITGPGGAVASYERRLRRHLAQGAEGPRSCVERAEALTRAGVGRQPARDLERCQGGQQSIVVELRPLPLAVDAAEELRRDVVRRNAVVGAFKNYGVTATVDVTHLRVSATISVKNAQKMFGTKWDLYATGETNQAVALPVEHAEAGVRAQGKRRHRVRPRPVRHRARVSQHVGVAARGGRTARSMAGRPPARARSTRAARPRRYPARRDLDRGLFPNQILDAYGIAPLQADGLAGPGHRASRSSARRRRRPAMSTRSATASASRGRR